MIVVKVRTIPALIFIVAVIIFIAIIVPVVVVVLVVLIVIVVVVVVVVVVIAVVVVMTIIPVLIIPLRSKPGLHIESSASYSTHTRNVFLATCMSGHVEHPRCLRDGQCSCTTGESDLSVCETVHFN